MGNEKRSPGAKKAAMTVILGVLCGAAAVMLVAARRPMPTTEMAANVEPAAVVPAGASNAAAPAVEAALTPGAATSTTGAEKTVVKPAKKAPAKKTAASLKPPVAASVPVQSASAGTAATEIPMATPQLIEEPKAAMTAEVPMATVTINGCLERDGNTFRLKNADGAAAPKTRSWKSGFLKRGSAKIEVIDTANRLKLRDHVGQRVSISGMLDDREMHARSVQRVSTFCE